MDADKNIIDLSDDMKRSLTVYKNISQDVAVISVDKLELILNDYDNRMKKNKNWQELLAYIISLLLAMLTSSFKDTFGVHKEYWTALFCMILIVSLILLLITSVNSYKNRKYNIKSVINRIKSASNSDKDN